MADIQALIGTLAKEAPPRSAVSAPMPFLTRALGILCIYAAGVVAVLGVRTDVFEQLSRPFYTLELLLLAVVMTASLWAAALLRYPDRYQHGAWITWPFYSALLFSLLLGIQFAMPHDPRMVMPAGSGIHEMECALCIGAVAFFPAALLMAVLRSGATVLPMTLGLSAVLASTAAGCIAIRLAEANDSLAHVLVWHYLPTALFAALGAALGKKIFHW